MTGEARPGFASGCNQDVCIEIVGTSNHVTDWDTQAYWNGGAKCTRARYLANGRQILLGSVICEMGRESSTGTGLRIDISRAQLSLVISGVQSLVIRARQSLGNLREWRTGVYSTLSGYAPVHLNLQG